MNKVFKKISALLIVAMLILSMSAMAATTTDNAGTVTSDTQLTIKKEIAFFNPDGKTINYPAVEFTYSIASSDPNGATVTDSDGDVATVKAGVDGGVVMDTDNKATFAAGSVVATTTGAIVSDTFDVKVDLTKFTAAGIYRYAITETAPTNYTNLGYEAATSDYGTRYLDLYIQNGTDGLEVMGYVLFHSSSSSHSITAEEPTVEKTEGFTHEDSDSDYSDDTYVDKYKTYNVVIEKEITGNLADKTHKFPMYVSGAAGASASGIKLGVEKTGTATAVEDITLASGAFAKTEVASLANGDTVTITGIPVGTTLTINEKNDTSDTYEVTTTGLASNLNKAKLASNTESTASTVTTTAVEKKEVKFTNNLPDISVTGVTLRVAPFALMLLAGLALLLISRRRKVVD